MLAIGPINTEISKMAVDSLGRISIAFTDVTGVRIPVGTPLRTETIRKRLARFLRAKNEADTDIDGVPVVDVIGATVLAAEALVRARRGASFRRSLGP